MLTDNDTASIVLNGGRKNLGCRCAEAIHEDGKRAVVGNPRHRVRIVQTTYTAAGISQLHHGPVIDKQAGQSGCFGQVAAAIAAQVHDQAIDALFLKFADKTFHILGRAGVVLVAIRQGAIVAIKRGHFDDANAPLTTVSRNRNNVTLGGLLLEFHLATRQGDNFFATARNSITLDDLQPDDGIAGSADQVHHIVETPAYDIDHFAVFAFGNTGYQVVRFELAIDGCRAARYDADDLYVVIVRLQRCTDTEIGQAHLNPVFLGISRRQVAGVGVERVCECVHEALKNVVAVDLVHAPGEALVTLGEQFFGFVPGLVVQDMP